MHRRDRQSGKHGGVAIFVREHLAVRPRPDLLMEDLEVVWVEIRGARRTILLGCAYRQPSLTVDYWHKLQQSLEYCVHANADATLVLVGDFNVNVLCDHAAQIIHLKATCTDFGLVNHVVAPTRHSGRVSTCLDLILAPQEAVSQCSVTPVDVSDHCLVTAALQAEVKEPPVGMRFGRKLGKVNLEAFAKDLEACGINELPEDMEADALWTLWKQKYMHVLDKHAPLKAYRPRARKGNPWVDDINSAAEVLEAV